MKARLTVIFAMVLASAGHGATNVPPVVQVISAAMRPGTTLMDVTYRITDPDDATVKVRALAFVNGTRSFSNVLRPTFVEGTQTNIGDAVATGVNHTLTWDVRAAWNIDLGQLKFEVLCRDSRGLLAFDWITVPAAGGQPALTISKNAPTDSQVLDVLFWQYATGDPALTLTNGLLYANSNSGCFAGFHLVEGSSVQPYAPTYIFRQMNLDPASVTEVKYTANTARAGLSDVARWHAMNRPYGNLRHLVAGWGRNDSGQTIVPAGLTDLRAIKAGICHSLALTCDGTVVAWGRNIEGQTDVPAGLTGVTAIAAGEYYSLALNGDGTVVAWGSNSYGQTNVPAGLVGVTAIAAGGYHGLALKNDGTVVAWGLNEGAQTNVPGDLTSVKAIEGGYQHSLALKSNGTVVAWGRSGEGQTNVPPGLTGVTAIAAGAYYNLALKSDGTVLAWGAGSEGQTDVPAGLTGVTAIAAAYYHSLALKSDGTVVAWGEHTHGIGGASFGQTSIPAGLAGVTMIAAGGYHSLAVKSASP